MGTRRAFIASEPTTHIMLPALSFLAQTEASPGARRDALGQVRAWPLPPFLTWTTLYNLKIAWPQKVSLCRAWIVDC